MNTLHTVQTKQKIGLIIHLQIQPESIKVGVENRYDPTRIFAVDEVLLTRDGVVGVTQAGERIIDVHNERHPRTQSRGDNGFSFGFTSHYEKMRARFGAHILDACAGENIIVATEKIYTLSDLRNRLAIRKTDTGECIYLNEIQSIVPCVPFSTFAAQRPLASSELKETLQFLMNGTRGFLAELVDSTQTVSIHVGDELFIC